MSISAIPLSMVTAVIQFFRNIPKSAFLPCRSALQIVRKHSLGFARISWGGAIFSPEQKRYLLGKQYESEKKAEKIFHGNQYTLAKKSGGSHDDTHHSGKKTCDRIAEENGVSRASVLRARHYTKGIFQGASIQGAPCFCFEKKLEK